MNINSKLLTFLVNGLLSLIGLYLSIELGLYLAFPVLFSLGTPLINLETDIWIKLQRTFIITVSTATVFLLTIGTSLVFGFIFFPVILSGLAGILTLWIFSISIHSVKPTFRL